MTTTYGYYDPDGYDDWFDNPLDKMPIATNKDENTYSSRHQSTPEFEKTAEEVVTMHEKMYRMATKSGKHTIGGGSEQIQEKND